MGKKFFIYVGKKSPVFLVCVEYNDRNWKVGDKNKNNCVMDNLKGTTDECRIWRYSEFDVNHKGATQISA